MALSRKFLTTLGIEADKADEIISRHSETVDALKEQIADYKSKAENFDDLKSKYTELEKQAKTEDGFKSKYEEVQKELDDLKNKVSADKVDRAKKSTFKSLLKEAGIGDKYTDSIMRITDFGKLDLDENNEIKDKENVLTKIKDNYGDFVVKSTMQGAKVETPPTTKGASISKEDILAIKDARERQRAIAEHLDLFD